MKVVKLALISVMLLAGLVPAATAQDILMPTDGCIGVVHFPDEPIGDAPSKMIVGVVLPPEFAGDMFTFQLSGASGDQVGMGTVDPDGLAFADAPLYSYGTHLVGESAITNAMSTPVDLSFLGEAGSFVVDAVEPVCDATVLTPLPPTTSSTTTTTTGTTTTTTETPTSSAAPSTTVGPTTTEPAPGGGEGDFPWPGVLIGGGLIALIAGAFVTMGGGKRDCDRERENLAKEQRRLGEINETLEQALGDMRSHEGEVRELEVDLEAWRKSKQRGSSTEKGITYYAHDGRRVPGYELDAEIEYLEGLLRIAKEALERDEQRVREWHQKSQEAEQKVREAEEALAKCLGEESAPAPLPAASGTGAPSDPSGPSGPSVAPPPPDVPVRQGCEDGTTYSRTGAPETIRPVVDFTVVVTVVEGSERKVGEADAMAVGLGDAATALDLLGKTLGAAGAANSIRTGIGGLASGSYVMGAGGLAKGTAEGAMASGLTAVSVPTSPPEALVEVVKGAAKLGEFVSRKVGEWLVMNQLYDVHLTLFEQTITATPYFNYRCVNGEWKCDKVWQYTVGPLRRRGRTNKRTFRLESDVARHRMQSEVDRLGRYAQGAIATSLQERADFDARHQPGPCE